jgi:hypothetical protein
VLQGSVQSVPFWRGFSQEQKMQLSTKQRVLGAALVPTVCLATAALAQSAMRLMVNGKTASTGIQIIGGSPYVPLSDMARAMNGTAVKRKGGGYEIVMGGVDTTAPQAAGGANEVRGTSGRIGQVLFNGKWRFAVLSVARAATYDSQFLADKQTFTPAGDTEELVVVRCRLKNGQKTAQKAMLSPIHPHNIALADDQGQSYAPKDFDKRGGDTDTGPSLLPGAQTEFAILFSVPRGTSLKDLVFSLQTAYDDYPNGGTDVRISLVQ